MVITDENGLYTRGGATTFWNLLLYLVEKYVGREMAIIAAKYFLLDIDRTSQLPFSVFKGQRSHGDKVILEAQDYIEKHFHEKFSIEELAARFGLGRRTLERRFKKATANKVFEYIQRVKVEHAKKQLEGGRKTVQEVMYEVGYNDAKAFRDVFRNYSGITPAEYKEKYGD